MPIARCPANDVESWAFPFYVAEAKGMEPVFLYLEDHLYNFDEGEREAIGDRLRKISSEEDLAQAGFAQGSDGVWVIA